MASTAASSSADESGGRDSFTPPRDPDTPLRVISKPTQKGIFLERDCPKVFFSDVCQPCHTPVANFSEGAPDRS